MKLVVWTLPKEGSDNGNISFYSNVGVVLTSLF
jgi:hypothetical protein